MRALIQPQGLADDHFFKLLEAMAPPVIQLSGWPGCLQPVLGRIC